MSLIQSLLNIVEEHSVTHDFKKVNSLKLSFGQMNHIEPHSLEFAFKVQSKGTKAEGAKLEFEILPVVIHCFRCSDDFEVDRFEFTSCPKCRTGEVKVVGGTEDLRLLEMEVD